MRNVLADLALEVEAATALSMRVARAVDARARDPHEAALARIATALGKYWVCKRAPALVNEAQECLGGRRLRRGVEPAAALSAGAAQFDLGGLRQHPVPRCAAALSREPETRDAFFAE
jgi:putative acyl-CoA dehydrogenase